MSVEPGGATGEAPSSSSGVLRGFRIALGAVCAVLVLGSIAARSGSRAWPFEVFSNLPVQFVILGAFALAVAIALRARTSIVLALVCVALNVGPIISTLRSDQPPADPTSQRLRFTSLNAQNGVINVQALRAHVEEERPDVLVVLDPAPSQRLAFDDPPSEYTSYATGGRLRVETRTPRISIWSRIPLADVRHPAAVAFGPSATEFTLRINGERVAFLGIGSDSPTTNSRAQERNDILQAAATWSRMNQDDGARVIVMGDYNATKWSPVVKLFAHQGRLHDSLDGFGIQPSWPTSNPFLLVPIDNAYLSHDLVATDRSTGPSFGSLHRSLTVTVAAAATE
jgi:endonuclease/exonuclease/phosphatase (EEP) superfamily protein YafD